MYLFKFSTSFMLIIAFLISCKHEKQETTVIKKNYKPEEVIALWQNSVDNNKYDEAKQFSADEILEYIESMQEASVLDTIQVIPSSFVDIKSTQKSDSVVELTTILKYEDGVQTNDTYVLVKRNGSWLIKNILSEEEHKESVIQ